MASPPPRDLGLLKRHPAMQPIPPARIVLAGFMGSGKTTVGRLLAAQLGWTFLDLDDEITQRCGMTVPEIFASFGEPHFRQQESLALADCLSRAGIVLALGGGAPENPANRALLRQSAGTAVVFLAGAFEVLQARCLAQSEDVRAVARPVFADADLARRRFAARAPHYEAIATLTLDTDGQTPEALAAELAVAFRSVNHGADTP